MFRHYLVRDMDLTRVVFFYTQLLPRRVSINDELIQLFMLWNGLCIILLQTFNVKHAYTMASNKGDIK